MCVRVCVHVLYAELTSPSFLLSLAVQTKLAAQAAEETALKHEQEEQERLKHGVYVCVCMRVLARLYNIFHLTSLRLLHLHTYSSRECLQKRASVHIPESQNGSDAFTAGAAEAAAGSRGTTAISGSNSQPTQGGGATGAAPTQDPEGEGEGESVGSERREEIGVLNGIGLAGACAARAAEMCFIGNFHTDYSRI